MTTITLSQKEYQKLKNQARAFQEAAARFFASAIGDSVDDIVQDFQSTDLYSKPFLHDLEQGLKKSSYRTSYAPRANSQRSRSLHKKA